jgi:hypothetical protein
VLAAKVATACGRAIIIAFHAHAGERNGEVDCGKQRHKQHVVHLKHLGISAALMRLPCAHR